MFRTFQYRLRRSWRGNLRLTAESLCGKVATSGIVPPWEYKLFEIRPKKSKVGAWLCGWGLLRQRPPFVNLRNSRSMTGMPVNFEMRRARSGEGRALPLRIALRYTGCVSSSFAKSRCFNFKGIVFNMVEES